MRYAWIENNQIRDIATGNPADIYHPEIAAHYNTEVPDDAANGDGWVGGVLVKPAPFVPLPDLAKPPAFVPLVISPVEFMLLFTSAERVAMKTARSTDPVIDDWMDIVGDPRLTQVDLGLSSTKDAIAYLVAKGLLTADRRDEILSTKK